MPAIYNTTAPKFFWKIFSQSILGK